ncbi:MAG: hypothetical protein E7295_14130 [Lachnospiraceae bacterium]|nr:hypothetical protein [Lachnospiraceae bacterium]
MSKIKEMIKKHWITAWIILAIMGIVSTVALAEYMGQKNRIMRVAANVAGAGQPFDSNYLSSGDVSISNVPFPAASEGWCTIQVEIWNYNSNNPQKAYNGALIYDLTAQLVTSNGSLLPSGSLGSYQIGVSSDNGTTYTYFSSYDETNGYFMQVQSSKLFAAVNGEYVPSIHPYVIRFPSALLNNPGIYVKLTATPTDTEKLSALSAILGVTKQETTLSRVWEGRFNEDTTKTDYDSFNYVVSGSGESDVTFSWCTDYLQINEFNLTDYGFTATASTRTENGESTNWKTITFRANSSDTYDSSGTKIGVGKNRYDFQLYMTTVLKNVLISTMNEEGATETDYWDAVKEYVEFSTVPVSGE